jgi:hypothetical protein
VKANKQKISYASQIVPHTEVDLDLQADGRDDVSIHSVDLDLHPSIGRGLSDDEVDLTLDVCQPRVSANCAGPLILPGGTVQGETSAYPLHRLVAAWNAEQHQLGNMVNTGPLRRHANTTSALAMLRLGLLSKPPPRRTARCRLLSVTVAAPKIPLIVSQKRVVVTARF